MKPLLSNFYVANQLPAMRLYPPGINPNSESAWFIELLTEPESTDEEGRIWYRMIIDDEHYGLPSFRFLSITAYLPEEIEHLGIQYARPSMMVLANLLEHPEIKPERMRSPFEGRKIKRSNKDLGRVLAIGFLAEEAGTRDFRLWGNEWARVLKSLFEAEWKTLARRAGKGLRALLDSSEDLEEAHHTCRYGLLSAIAVTEDDLREVGERIIGDAIETLEDLAD